MPNGTGVFKDLLNFFLESSCFLCQRQTTVEFCQACVRQIQRQALSEPDEHWQGQLPVFAWGVYGGTLKRAIAALKYQNQPQIARPLGYWLAESWLNSQPLLNRQGLIVVPIPLHVSKQQQRGYNQAALLAQSFCETTGLCLQLTGLERVRATAAQFGTKVREREENLAEAFALGRGFCNYHPANPVLLLDVN